MITMKSENEGRNERMIERVSKTVKTDTTDVRGISIHPLDPEDMNVDRVHEIIPKSLLNLLKTICGDSKRVQSIAQEIVSAGKKQMLKNTCLGISLINSLRLKGFIMNMNNFGHSISYDDVQRIETTWASSIIESGDAYAILPSNTVSILCT